MSGPIIGVNHGFSATNAGEPLVSLDIDGDLTLLTPEQALTIAQWLVKHAKEAMAESAAASSAGAQRLASMPAQGRS